MKLLLSTLVVVSAAHSTAFALNPCSKEELVAVGQRSLTNTIGKESFQQTDWTVVNTATIALKINFGRMMEGSDPSFELIRGSQQLPFSATCGKWSSVAQKNDTWEGLAALPQARNGEAFLCGSAKAAHGIQVEDCSLFVDLERADAPGRTYRKMSPTPDETKEALVKSGVKLLAGTIYFTSSNIEQATWSPDLKLAAFASNDGRRLNLFDTTIGNSEVIAESVDRYAFGGIRFSPDSKKVAFMRIAEGISQSVVVYDTVDKSTKNLPLIPSQGQRQTTTWVENDLPLIMRNLPGPLYPTNNGRILLSPNKTLIIHDYFPFLPGYDDSSQRAQAYSIAKSAPVILPEKVFNPQFGRTDAELFYLSRDPKGPILRRLDLSTLKPTTVSHIPFEHGNFPSWGASLCYLSAIGSAIVGIHYSRTKEDAEGFGYDQGESRPDVYRFFTVDIKSGELKALSEISNPGRTSPFFPNIIFEPSPKEDLVLVLSSGANFIWDPKTGATQSIALQIVNSTPLRFLQDSGAISRSTSIVPIPTNFNNHDSWVQWSTDGKMIGTHFGGLILAAP